MAAGLNSCFLSLIIVWIHITGDPNSCNFLWTFGGMGGFRYLCEQTGFWRSLVYACIVQYTVHIGILAFVSGIYSIWPVLCLCPLHLLQKCHSVFTRGCVGKLGNNLGKITNYLLFTEYSVEVKRLSK